ncbi:MAG: hypothetical protein K0S74_930 [Chlamydiales bacterium]|jgi:glycosyltransferase involved in cell wall biosynthesis|nr:hypothetical protein [Chlamydiales bacterium]
MSQPLISIVCVVKNRVHTIKRCLDSLISQSYPNKQIIVQDGASTDGTLEILKAYGDAIELISESDSSLAEGWFRALQRVRGEYFIISFSDEELLPGALEWGAYQFKLYSGHAAIYGNIYVTDLEGVVERTVKGEDWNYERYICSELIHPPTAATFFSKKHYDTLKIDSHSCLESEFSIFAGLGLRYPLKYVDAMVAKFAMHNQALSSQGPSHVRVTLDIIRQLKELFKSPFANASLKKLEKRALGGTYLHGSLQIVNTLGKDCNEKHLKLALDLLQQALKYEFSSEKLYYVSAIITQQTLNLIKVNRLELAYFCIEVLDNLPIPLLGINYIKAVLLKWDGKLEESQKALDKENSIINSSNNRFVTILSV